LQKYLSGNIIKFYNMPQLFFQVFFDLFFRDQNLLYTGHKVRYNRKGPAGSTIRRAAGGSKFTEQVRVMIRDLRLSRWRRRHRVRPADPGGNGTAGMQR
jgi:hypothetical protein